MRKQFGGHDEKQPRAGGWRDRGGPRRRRGGRRARRRADRRGGAARGRRPRQLLARGQRRPRAVARCSRSSATDELDWDAIELFQVDERIAPPGNEDRNLTHLRARACSLAAPGGAAADAGRPSATSRRPPRELRRARCPSALDLVHLGLGPDGHTASLVPGDPVLEVDRPPRRAHRRVPGPPPHDAHLSGDRRRPRGSLWLVTGADKRDALAKLLAGDPSIPAGRVRARDATLAGRAPRRPASEP